MKKPFFTLKQEGNTTVINIDGYIGEDVEYAPFRDALLNAITAGAKRLKFKINSGGGSIIEGSAIYDVVKSFNLLIEVEIIGMAASMAGVLSQLASPGMLGIYPNASVMTHRPKSGPYGESDQLRSAADFCDDLESKIIKIYESRTGKTTEQVKAWFKPGVDTWFTAEKAVAAGLVDYIITTDAVSKDKRPTNFKSEADVIGFYNSLHEKPKSNKMNKLLMAVVLMLNKAGVTNVNADSSEDEVIAAFNKYDSDITAKIVSYENSIKDANKKRAADLVNNAIKLGKLPTNTSTDDKAKWISRAEKDFEMVNDLIGGDAAPVTVDFNAQLDKDAKGGPAASNAGGENKDNKPRAEWTLLDWEKKDPKGLRNMLTNDLAGYQKLFKAYHGVDFKA